MKILYIQQYFKTPREAGSTRSYWISKELLKRGYKVTVVCHANTLLGQNQKKIIDRRNVDGIDVIFIRNAYSNNMNALQRMWSFSKFMFLCTFVTLKERNINLVFASSTPLTVAFPALLKKWIHNTKFVFEVRDLWPEAPIQLGVIKNKFFIKFLRWFEQTTYRNAEHIITLSPGMREGVERYVPSEKVSMIPNMAKIHEFWIRERAQAVNEQFGLSNKSFKIVYFGTLGMANGIDYLIQGITLIESRNIKDIEFVFMGEGIKKDDLKLLREGLSNVKISILGRQPMENVSKIVNNCDVSVCTFSDVPILKTNSPNKLFDALSAGKPTIVNSDGWTKEIVEIYECGIYVDPKQPEAFVDAVMLFRRDTDMVTRMGQNARLLAESKFDKGILCRQLADVLENELYAKS